MATYYVRADADGLGNGTTAAKSGATGAWTWTQFMTAWGAGATLNANDDVNICSNGGQFNLTSTDAPTRDGGSTAPITIAGCISAKGDLGVPTYNVDGSLNVTNWPVVNYSSTGRLSASGVDGAVLRQIVWKANVNNNTVTLGANCTIISCRVENANTGANTEACALGTVGDAIDCDFVLTGGSGTYTAVDSSGGTVTNCRVWGAPTRGIWFSGNAGMANGCTIFGSPSAVGIDWSSTNTTHEVNIRGNTIVGCTTGIRFAAAAHTRLVQVVNNHITGCTTGILSLYDGTAQIPILCMGNRLRNTTNVDGFDNWYAATGGDLRNTVTAGTDAGDYVNPSLNDYRIKSGSPGATAGLGGLSAGSRGSDARGGVLLRPGRAGRF